MFDVFSPCLILIMNVSSIMFHCDYYNMLKSWTPAVYSCDSNDLYIHICVYMCLYIGLANCILK